MANQIFIALYTDADVTPKLARLLREQGSMPSRPVKSATPSWKMQITWPMQPATVAPS